MRTIRPRCAARRRALALAALLALGGSLPAQDLGWSRFRGPNGAGLAVGEHYPARLNEDGALAFRVPVLPGRSSPVLWGRAVYLTGFEEDALSVLALDRKDGHALWTARVSRTRRTVVDARNDPASPSSAVDARGVVSFFPDFGLVAHDHEGKERWRLELGPFVNVYGMGASPILAGDRVLLACDQNQDSFLLAVSNLDGSVLWKTERPEAKSGHCTPILSTADDGSVEVLLPGSFLLDAYAVDSGERRWWVRGLSFEMKSTPVLADGVVYINGYGSPLNQPGRQVSIATFALADADASGQVDREEMPGNVGDWFDFVDLDADAQLSPREWEYLRAALSSLNGMLAIEVGGQGDRTEQQVRWTWRRSVPQLPSPLLAGGVLLLLADSGGLITSLDPGSGELIERGRIEGAIDAFYASPVAGGGRVYLLSETGRLVVLPEGGEFEPLCLRDLQEPCYATPALADGRLYVRSDQALWAFQQPPR